MAAFQVITEGGIQLKALLSETEAFGLRSFQLFDHFCGGINFSRFFGFLIFTFSRFTGVVSSRLFTIPSNFWRSTLRLFFAILNLHPLCGSYMLGTSQIF
jgi:hypothetical protein